MARAVLLAVALVSMGLAGCLDAQDEDAPLNTSRFDAPATTVLLVEVVSIEQRPVPEANVRVESTGGPATAITDDTGLARFDTLPPGEATLVVEAPDHRPHVREVLVREHTTERVTVTLSPLGIDQSYVETYEFAGFFECSATFLIITGDCFATTRAIGEETGLPLGENTTNERFVLPFPVAPGWTKIVITQTWDDAQVAAGSMMRVNLEPGASKDNERHNDRYARVQGASPLVLELVPGQLHDLASAESLVMPEQGGWFQTRSFHLGFEEAHDPTGAGTLGAGAAFQQHFQLVVDVHYG